MIRNDLVASDELKDTLQRLSVIMESKILELQMPDRYAQSVGELFRHFHSLKALCYHLRIKSIFMTAKVVEEILSILRQKKPPIKHEIVDWLLHITDSVKEWSELAQEDKFDFEPIDVYTLSMVKSSVIVSRTPKEIMSALKLIYLDDDKSRSAQVTCVAMDCLPNISMAYSWEMAQALLDKGFGHILIINTKFNDMNIDKKVAGVMENYNIPVLAVSHGKIDEKIKAKFQKAGVEFFLNEVLSEDLLFKRLVNIAKAYYEEKSIKVNNSKLLSRIGEFQPLSSAAFEINRIKSNPDVSLKDIADIVSKDPMVSAKILKIANSPFSGLKGLVTSIHHAVSLMGKDQIVGMVIQSEVERCVRMNLAPYMMTERDFYAIACMRANLATYWYPKVSVAKTGVVATAALLANLGQLVIAEEVEKSGVRGRFQELIQTTSTPMFAEIEIFGTTSEDTTANILTKWGLDDTIVNMLHYSNDIANANDELKQEAFALFVIFNTIPSIPSGIDDEKVTEMSEFLKEMNFNPEHYLRAVERVKTECRL